MSPLKIEIKDSVTRYLQVDNGSVEAVTAIDPPPIFSCNLDGTEGSVFHMSLLDRVVATRKHPIRDVTIYGTKFFSGKNKEPQILSPIQIKIELEG